MATTPPSNPNDPLLHYWEQAVRDLVQVEQADISVGMAERHTLYSMLVMALVFDAFNGNKCGPNGDYPWREKQRISPQLYRGDKLGDRYFGHNIACIAVDARGKIIDFEFNHNELYNSSAEHAEARLVRRIFNLSQLNDGWQTVDLNQDLNIPYITILSGVTLYTSLESCAQCSGIMALGNVNRVIYLQSDPGQYRIGNILYNLSNPLSVSHPHSHPAPCGKTQNKYGAPEPVSADLFGFALTRQLETGYDAYCAKLPTTPFWDPLNGAPKKNAPSITEFLCTDLARDIFEAGANALKPMALKHPDYVVPYGDPASAPLGFTNREAHVECLRFRRYAAAIGRRATPHH